MNRIEAMEKALGVLILDPNRRAFLEATDPKALQQAEIALGMRVGFGSRLSKAEVHQFTRKHKWGDDRATRLIKDIQGVSPESPDLKDLVVAWEKEAREILA